MERNTKTYIWVVIIVVAVATGAGIWYAWSNTDAAGTFVAKTRQQKIIMQPSPPSTGCPDQSAYSGSMPGYQQVGNVTISHSEDWVWKTIYFSEPTKVADIRLLNANQSYKNSYKFDRMVVNYANGNTSEISRNNGTDRCANYYFGITDGFSKNVSISSVLIKVKANEYGNQSVPIQIWVKPN